MASSGNATTGISTGTSHDWVGLTDVQRAVLSQEVRLKVQPLLRFRQFAVEKTELGKTPGQEIEMLAFGNLPMGGRLSEGVHIETKSLSTSTMSIEVDEFGNAVAATEKLLHASFADLLNQGSQLLAMDAAKVIDIECRRAIDATVSAVVYGSAVANRSSIAAGKVLTTDDIDEAAMVLSENKVPKYVGIGRECYVCFVHPRATKVLRQSDDWREPSLYAGATQLFRGELGRYNDVVFIETTMCPIITAADAVLVDGVDVTANETDDTNGAAVSVYKSYMIGGDTLGFAEGLPIEIREDGIKDFGRERGIAWYGIFGAAMLDFDGDEIKAVRLESAAV